MANPHPSNRNPPIFRGHSKAKVRAIISISAQIREEIPTDVIVQFWWSIMQGKNPKVVEYDDGSHGVEWEERGDVAPTLDQKMRAADWLMNRGYGMPVQSVQLEQQIRLDAASTQLPRGALPVGAIMALRGVVAAARGALPPPPASEMHAIEVPDPFASEHEDSNKGADGPASDDHATVTNR